MAQSINILNTNLIDKQQVIQKIEKVSKELGLRFGITDTSAYFASNQDITFEINFLTPEKFNQSKQDGYYGSNKGLLFFIFIYGEKDDLILSFLKKLLSEYPNFLIFIDEGEALNNPFTYSKAHLDIYKGNSLDGIFSKPPKL